MPHTWPAGSMVRLSLKRHDVSPEYPGEEAGERAATRPIMLPVLDFAQARLDAHELVQFRFDAGQALSKIGNVAHVTVTIAMGFDRA